MAGADASTTYASSISYFANGMPDTVVHGNGPGGVGVEDRHPRDPHWMRRPRWIYTDGATQGGQDADWDSGVFGYDGAGNIVTMGDTVNLYDRLSRLVSSTTTDGAGQNAVPGMTK